MPSADDKMRKPTNNRPTNRPLRSSGAATRHVLDVRVRRSTVKRQRSRKVVSAVFGVLLWSSLIAATWFGFHAITDKFFLSNPEYTLRHLSSETQGLLTESEVAEITGIRRGVNIFKIDLSAAENALRKLDQIATVRITRDWPDRISVEVTKRSPISWISDRPNETPSADNAILIDRTGRTMKPFRVEPEFWHLPVIYCTSVEAIQSGDILAVADLTAATDLLSEVRKRPDSLLKIRSIDITRGHTIQVTAADNSTILFSPENPTDQLEKLEPLLVHCLETERTLEFANLIPSRYTPVRIQMAAAPESAPAPPAKTPKR